MSGQSAWKEDLLRRGPAFRHRVAELMEHPTSLEGEVPPLKAAGPRPALWIRVHQHFAPRWSEWLMAVAMFGWGLIVVGSPAVFDLPTYAGFRAIFGSAAVIGPLVASLGLLRLLALWVNGRRRHVTYWARVIGAGSGCMIWVGMVYAHALSGVIAPWAILYPAFAVTELINAGRSGHDIGASDGLAG